MVAGSRHLATIDHADPGTALLGTESAGSKPRPVGWVHAGAKRRPHIFRWRHRVRPLLSRCQAATRSNRPRTAADRCLRAALVHANRSYESGGGGAGAPG